MIRPLLLWLVLAAMAVPAAAQEADVVEDVVVVAQRAGAPMWTITRGPSTLILVGEVDGLARDIPWRPDALEDAAARSQLILLPHDRRASVADIGRLLWRARSAFMLPGEETTADHLPTDDQARLERIFSGDSPAWARKKLTILSFDLLEKAGYRRRGDREMSDVLRRAGRREDVPARTIGVLHGDDFVEMLITSPQSRHTDCIHAAIPAAEGSPGLNVTRAEDWRGLRVAAVLANPLEQAIGRCWPYGDPDVGRQITDEWLGAIQIALTEPGVTMGVAPLRLLAEAGGVLDGLETEGLDIRGPDWKAAD